MIFEHTNYRSYLKEVLVEKIRSNPSYSLRAFSTQVGLSASMLSEVLNGKKKLSTEKAALVANRLKLKNKEEYYFLDLVQLDNVQDIKQREQIISRIKEQAPDQNMKDLSIDHFYSIANWICVAGMAALSGYPKGLSAMDIAKKLGVTKFEASEAMDRWVRLELLNVKNGQYIRNTNDHLMMKSQAPNEAIRKFHKVMLEKAIDSLEKQNNHEKFVGSETIAIGTEHLEEVSEVIEEAVAKILRIAKTTKKKGDVYHLGFQFFRLSKKGDKNEK